MILEIEHSSGRHTEKKRKLRTCLETNQSLKRKKSQLRRKEGVANEAEQKIRKCVVIEIKRRTCFKKEEGLSYANIADKDAWMWQHRPHRRLIGIVSVD